MRRGTRDDLDRVALLHRASILELCRDHYTEGQLAEWTDALRPEGYAMLLATREFFVFEQDGDILGFGVLDPTERVINATYVSPAAAGRGVGRALVESMERVAVQMGVPELRLHSTLNAVSFYEKLGFFRGKAAMNRFPSGVELPCVVMTKCLG